MNKTFLLTFLKTKTLVDTNLHFLTDKLFDYFFPSRSGNNFCHLYKKFRTLIESRGL